jgi:nicotinamidase-related amidase
MFKGLEKEDEICHSKSMDISNFILDRDDSILLIVDIQERLASVMKYREQVAKNVNLLVELAKMLDIPVLVSEQYPKGLGHTVAEVKETLPVYAPVEKISFDCCGKKGFVSAIKKYGRKKIIVTGMESHICVLQTVLGLLGSGYIPHVVSDAVCSRTKENWKAGIEMMRDAGAVITCTEAALFQLLKEAGTEEFKAISKLIK